MILQHQLFVWYKKYKKINALLKGFLEITVTYATNLIIQHGIDSINYVIIRN